MEEDAEWRDDISEKLSQMCVKAERMFDTTIDGFEHHSLKKIEGAESMANEIHTVGEELIASLSNISGKTKEEKEQLKELISATTHLQRAVDAIKGMLPHVKIKINEDILFSDKAIGELRYLFENTREILKNAGDTFLTRNRFLLDHVLDKGSYLNKLADSYALEHEDRLISGVCMPKASPMFLNILESTVKVNWHTMMALKKFFFFKKED